MKPSNNKNLIKVIFTQYKYAIQYVYISLNEHNFLNNEYYF